PTREFRRKFNEELSTFFIGPVNKWPNYPKLVKRFLERAQELNCEVQLGELKNLLEPLVTAQSTAAEASFVAEVSPAPAEREVSAVPAIVFPPEVLRVQNTKPAPTVRAQSHKPKKTISAERDKKTIDECMNAAISAINDFKRKRIRSSVTEKTAYYLGDDKVRERTISVIVRNPGNYQSVLEDFKSQLVNHAKKANENRESKGLSGRVPTTLDELNLEFDRSAKSYAAEKEASRALLNRLEAKTVGRSSALEAPLAAPAVPAQSAVGPMLSVMPVPVIHAKRRHECSEEHEKTHHKKKSRHGKKQLKDKLNKDYASYLLGMFDGKREKFERKVRQMVELFDKRPDAVTYDQLDTFLMTHLMRSSNKRGLKNDPRWIALCLFNMSETFVRWMTNSKLNKVKAYSIDITRQLRDVPASSPRIAMDTLPASVASPTGRQGGSYPSAFSAVLRQPVSVRPSSLPQLEMLATLAMGAERNNTPVVSSPRQLHVGSPRHVVTPASTRPGQFSGVLYPMEQPQRPEEQGPHNFRLT
ncbi:MAG: hypothetical protein EBX40_07070, partial [Gammaproteobacteria bacterium]|nr:hypothetical protein [Gammaproteobacteria bacterium]